MDIRKSSQAKSQRRWTLHIVDLPYDIIVTIFILCFKEHEEGKRSHFPTTASHVCRTWRQHALATPTFWTTLEFCQPVPALEKYQTWLERSNEAPLDIIIGYQPFKRASIKHAREIMRLTVPRIRQWRSLSVHGFPDKIFRLIFDRMGQEGAEKLGRLEMIKVVKDDYDPWFRNSMPRVRWKFKGFPKGEMPPNLRHIVLEGDTSHFFTVRLKKLQVLEILNRFLYNSHHSSHAVQSILEFLSSFPDLRTLRVDDGRYLRLPIEIDSTQRLPLYRVPMLKHDALTELWLQAPQETRNTIIASLILPNLRYLLDRRKREPVLGVCCLPHFAQNHPFPKLVSLRLGGSHSSRPPFPYEPNANAKHMAHLEEALAGLQELKALTFDHVDFEGGSGKSTYLSCVGRVCPRLRWLVLVRCVGYTLRDLISIAERRKRTTELDSLAWINVQDWKFPEGTEEDLEGLEPFVGLDFIDLHDYSYSDANDLVEREWMDSTEL